MAATRMRVDWDRYLDPDPDRDRDESRGAYDHHAADDYDTRQEAADDAAWFKQFQEEGLRCG